ncbi:hypothetical protein CERSUDRAFT_124041 [Gelatoporia subvermispora B]|uniref:WH1 domain-containing protein n=1 Tax=Ceriporiopsis subvermispora (strain B) TaxID=914234 RepID=M2QJ48_CERS8|nr:hypothetical protein CERSUDRAFT_124041 [Gelatoporia subvermispora B]
MATGKPSARSQTASSVSQDQQETILSHLPAESKVVAVASARIYHAAFGAKPDSWVFSGLKGILVLGRDRTTLHPDRKRRDAALEQNYWFRLLDTGSDKGVIWIHNIADALEYQLDKPFFHIFAGQTRMFGFCFGEDSEAEAFYRKLSARIRLTAPSQRKHRKLTTPSPRRRVSAAMISAPAPSTFVHVAHVGYDEKGHIEASDGVGPGWRIMLDELRGYGVSENMVEKERDFVDGFFAGAKAASAPASTESVPTRTPTAKRRLGLRRLPTASA